MNKCIVCGYSHNFVMGGIESYYIRMFEWANRNGYRSILLLNEGNYIHKNWKESLEKQNVHVAWCQRRLLEARLIDTQSIDLNNTYSYTMIAGDLHCYFTMSQLVRKYKICKANILFYIFHPYSIYASVKKKFLNYPYIFFMRRLNKNGIIFMDEETQKEYEHYYHVRSSKDSIIRLGLKIPPLDNDFITQRINDAKTDFTILTITRMDFPFKGYVFGLVDDFVKLKETNKKLKLIIIGNGKGKTELLKKINLLDQKDRQDICLCDEIPYVKINEYLKKCQLYVGMGTTLLDSSITGLVSIVATAFQKGNVSPGFFFSEYNNLGGNLKLSRERKRSFYDLISEVLLWDEDEYKDSCIKSYQIAKSFYNIDNNMKEIVRIQTDMKQLHPLISLLNIYDYFLAKVQDYDQKKETNYERSSIK